MEYRHIVITGTYMRHRWIPLVDLRGEFAWLAKKQRSVGESDENGKGEARLVWEPIGNGP